ncbi:MAG: dihydroorotase [Kiritimatiellae bacterium]|nr:dihydroorotase [Kiritimatiellia bacterium]
MTSAAQQQSAGAGRPEGRLVVLPAFADCHVHLREPGAEYKETIATGTAAAAAGGFSDVCAMPNINPVPDGIDALRVELNAIRRSARVRVHPFAAITRGQEGRELADFAALAPHVVGFSDDGHGLQDRGLAREAFAAARDVGRPISAHCEVNALIPAGGCVHDGAFARAHCLAGIPSASEWRMVERDLEIARDTGVRYHVCHISTRESAMLVRDAKHDGLRVTCETAPHYLLLCDADLRDEGRFKMNPPVRSAEDREALREALADGTIDCIATDHAPHSEEEKTRGLAGSAFGIVGLETAFPLCYTYLVETGAISLEALIDRMSTRPRAIFGLPPAPAMSDCSVVAETVEAAKGDIPPGMVGVMVGVRDRIDPARFRSKGRATPFTGWEVHARILCNHLFSPFAETAP